MLKTQEELMKLTACLGLPTEFDMEFCSNHKCNTRARAADLVEAPSSALVYFGLAFPKGKNKTCFYICKKCLRKAEEYYEESKNQVKDGGNLFSLKPELQSTNPLPVIDLEADENVRGSSSAANNRKICKRSESLEDKFRYSVKKSTFDVHFKDTIRKFDLEQLTKKATQTVEEEIKVLEEEFGDLDKRFEEALDKIGNLKSTFNEKMGVKAKCVELGSVDISEDGICNVTEMDNLTTELQTLNIRPSVEAVVNFRKTVTLKSSSSADTPLCLRKKSGNTQNHQSQSCMNSVAALQRKTILTSSNQVLNSNLKPLKFCAPGLNTAVYVPYGELRSFWTKGTIVELPSDSKPGYKIRLNPIAEPLDKIKTVQTVRSHPAKEVAFGKSSSSSITYPVGTRIIARFNDLLGDNPGFDGKYYASIVAEPLYNDRYLIFYDDGYVQYVNKEYVLPVVESSVPVWKDVDQGQRAFIRDYLNTYPCRDLYPAVVGYNCSVEFNGTWFVADVEEIDGSLMKIKYPKKSQVGGEWIYRGSTRICTNYDPKKTQLVEASNAGDRTVRITPETDASMGFNGRNKVVQLIEDYEAAGELRCVDVPRTCPLPKKYEVHGCSPKCCALRYVEDEHKGVSPLVVPFYLGWARKLNNANSKIVMYVSPCGVTLNSYVKVLDYNRLTKSGIPIEFFSFESNIDCLNMFYPTHQFQFIKDISHGKEFTPVQCVNSVNNLIPENMIDYRSNRVIGESVKMECDEGFLVCCDCEDDCSDKSKCACWKLTMEGVSFKSPDEDGIGYENRRLKQVVRSGIYECNQRCKCNVKTCLNRVAQNKVKWPLQIFRTLRKGWGARTLYDIPAGSFICLYSGKLMSDSQGNQEGLEFGDEYFADLDLIEVLEGTKEGYESDCSDIEKSDMEETVLSKKPKLHPRDSRLPLARKSTSDARRKDGMTEAGSRTSRVKKSYHGKPMPYRKYFGADEIPYIMDGKREGNIGRYFNHCCEPNVFIQNVFVDTHDLRFPWLAFFTSKDIKAGTELCWDYNYEVGSVPTKSLLCYCGAKTCRGRLL